MHSQDEELQIRLAEIQANVQIYIASAFGYGGICLSMLICILQIFSSLRIAGVMVDTLFFVILSMLLMVMLIFFVLYFINKAIQAKNEIEKLKMDK
jgi:energy-coupling factor transporter transmembrane protein EcfT